MANQRLGKDDLKVMLCVNNLFVLSLPRVFSVSRNRAGIFKPLWSPGIDAKASTPPAHVAWRAGTITLFLFGA